jgi:hypothetical protein
LYWFSLSPGFSGVPFVRFRCFWSPPYRMPTLTSDIRHSTFCYVGSIWLRNRLKTIRCLSASFRFWRKLPLSFIGIYSSSSI